VNARGDSGADPAYVRPLGEAEQGLDVMETAKALCHIVRVIPFEGALDAELFERALHQLVERRPLVNTRIVRPPEQSRILPGAHSGPSSLLRNGSTGNIGAPSSSASCRRRSAWPATQ
jgi:hypothetical protein